MKIIIVGDGKVGFTLSEQLSREGHDITVIDNRNDVLQRSMESLDVFTIKGNGANANVLKQAGVEKADLLIAATSSDEVNIVCCIMGKKHGAKNTIARIRNPEYSEQLRMMESDLGLSMIVNPEMASAKEISRLVSFPSALSLGTFADDRVYMAEFKVQGDNAMIGNTVSKMHEQCCSEILACSVFREGEVHIPGGNFVINDGDHIHVVGDYDSIEAYLKSMGHQEKKVKTVMIVGGGLIAYYLAKMLLGHGMEVKIIERDPERAEYLSDSLPGALIISADGTEKEILDYEGIARHDAFVALTDMDEENLIISMYAAYKGILKVITKINRLGYSDVIRKAGIYRVISPKNITANHIIRYVRSMQNLEGSHVKTIYRLMGNSAEVVEFIATASTNHIGTPIMELPLKKDILITTIVRDDKVIIPKGKDFILEGDSVIVISKARQFTDLNEIFVD